MNKTILYSIITASLFSACSTNLQELKVPTKHNPNLTLSQIGEIAPGMGSVMMEYSHRFYVAYYAAKAGNWDLADYEVEEMLEIQEVGEATRPKYTQALKSFENNHIKNIQKSIQKKSWREFDDNYQKTVTACNSCHAQTGHPYIKFKLPPQAPEFLSLGLK